MEWIVSLNRIYHIYIFKVYIEFDYLCCRTLISQLHHHFRLMCLVSHVQLFVTPCPVARQAPLSMGFSGKNTGVRCQALLQAVFPTQESDPGLPHCRGILYCLSHQGSPSSDVILTFVNYLPCHLTVCKLGKARRRQWHPAPVLLPGKSHGRRNLVGCSPWGC